MRIGWARRLKNEYYFQWVKGNRGSGAHLSDTEEKGETHGTCHCEACKTGVFENTSGCCTRSSNRFNGHGTLKLRIKLPIMPFQNQWSDLIFRNLLCKGSSNLLVVKELSHRITR